jgi:hypothetical protein
MSNSSPSIPSQAQDKRGGEVATLIQAPNGSPQTYSDGADFPRDRQAKLGSELGAKGAISHSLAFRELARISVV